MACSHYSTVNASPAQELSLSTGVLAASSTSSREAGRSPCRVRTRTGAGGPTNETRRRPPRMSSPSHPLGPLSRRLHCPRFPLRNASRIVPIPSVILLCSLPASPSLPLPPFSRHAPRVLYGHANPSSPPPTPSYTHPTTLSTTSACTRVCAAPSAVSGVAGGSGSSRSAARHSEGVGEEWPRRRRVAAA